VKKIFGIILYVHAVIWALTALTRIYFCITGYVDNIGGTQVVYFLFAIGQLILAGGAFAWARYLRKPVKPALNPKTLT